MYIHCHVTSVTAVPGLIPLNSHTQCFTATEQVKKYRIFPLVTGYDFYFVTIANRSCFFLLSTRTTEKVIIFLAISG